MEVIPQHISSPGHTGDIFDPKTFTELAKQVAERVREIRQKNPEAEALAASGHSGVMLMGAVSFITGLPMIAVRKNPDTIQDVRMANGWMGAKGYIILDDLIATGSTVDRIVSEIEEEFQRCKRTYDAYKKLKQAPKPVAIVLYVDNVARLTNVVFRGKMLSVPTYGARGSIFNNEVMGTYYTSEANALRTKEPCPPPEKPQEMCRIKRVVDKLTAPFRA